MSTNQARLTTSQEMRHEVRRLWIRGDAPPGSGTMENDGSEKSIGVSQSHRRSFKICQTQPTQTPFTALLVRDIVIGCRRALPFPFAWLRYFRSGELQPYRGCAGLAESPRVPLPWTGRYCGQDDAEHESEAKREEYEVLERVERSK